jgi:UDP-glucose 4-epimerase
MVLLTGATGYIASHTWLALLAAGYDVVGIDDFSNSLPEVLTRIEGLSASKPLFERANVCDKPALASLFGRYAPDAVIHFAARKAVGESLAQPLDYYSNNLGGLISVCEAMQATHCRRIVFSSSATVYGVPDRLPIKEDAALSAVNPYGQTKLMGETILRDLAASDAQWRIASLRYFNPVGAHPSGLIGEDPRGIPNNLMPYVAQVAVGRRAELQVFGDDYPTPDGTCIRDYIHVADLASAHVAAAERCESGQAADAYNVGRGIGSSVREVMDAVSATLGRDVAPEVVARRAGDPPATFAATERIAADLGWRATRDLPAMVESAWSAWQATPPS